jgi:hypothetical protein
MKERNYESVNVKFDGYTAIDIYINNAADRKNILIFSFGNLADGGSNSTGYAGSFLLDNGYSIVAFKASRKKNIWFQDLNTSAFTEIESKLKQIGIDSWKRIGYGSSMGGFGAIAYSKPLRLDSVLAYSPQFDIRQDWDTRWAGYAEQIVFTTEISKNTVNEKSVIAIACDPHDPDFLHLKKLSEVISAAQFKPLLFPYAGHPVGHFLKEINCLKKMALEFFDNGVTTTHISKELAKSSFTRNQTLAEVCIRRRKYFSALKVLQYILATQSLDASRRAVIFDLFSKVYELRGQYSSMMEYACKALDEDPFKKSLHIRWADLSMKNADLNVFVNRLNELREKGVINPGLTKRHLKALEKQGDFLMCKKFYEGLPVFERTSELLFLAARICWSFKEYESIVKIYEGNQCLYNNERFLELLVLARQKLSSRLV